MSNSSSLFKEYSVPLRITNTCPDVLWPAIGTQHGIGPRVGGLVLDSGESQTFEVSWDWQGRVWGRTNCSFNEDGSGPLNRTGVDGYGRACLTGDCGGKLSCSASGDVPSTLAEFNLWGGISGKQTFYDISLVDGYNIPVGIVYIPAPNTSFIPPNLVNPSCIATAGYLAAPSRSGTTYTNASFPMPYEPSQSNEDVKRWCPWDLQKFPPEKPGHGVFAYPDDDIERPVFQPCLSACSKTNSDEDCCKGDHNNPNVCKAGLYSNKAKKVCPDSYSFAYDDQTSTFIIPSGGGWEVVFCPKGRSTNILATFGDQLHALADTGNMSRKHLDEVMSEEYINSQGSAASGRPNAAAIFSMKNLMLWGLGLGLFAVL